MANDILRLDPIQLSAVYEMANIGLGHATTALADMTGRPFNMSIPSIDSVPVETIPNLVGGPEAISLGVFMPFEGDVDGYIAFILPWESACRIWEFLLGAAPNSPELISELDASAMLEVGNIINSNFLNAISDMTNLAMHATPPMISVEMSAAVVSTMLSEAEMRDMIALTVETKIFEMEGESSGYFVCIPSVSGLNKMFTNLGIGEAA